MTHDEISKLSDAEISEQIITAVQKANDNPQLCYAVFHVDSVYFTLGQTDVFEIPDDASCSPRGGWFPTIVSGLNDVEHAFFESAMEKYGFDCSFFNDITGDEEGLDWEYEDIEEKLEDDEQKLHIFQIIKELVETGSTPFSSLNEFVVKLKRYELEDGRLYYWWEGDYIDLFDNINETGEPRGEYDDLDDAEWLYILTNLSEFVVSPDNEKF